MIYDEKMYTILEVDIRDFFGSLNHGWLMQFLEHRLADKRILTNWDWFNEKVLKVWPLAPPRLKWTFGGFGSLAVL